MNMRKSVPVAIVLSLAALAGGALLYRHLAANTTSEPVSAAAPAVNFITLDGRTLSLASLHGHWVLINFWASWCAPCIDELPNFVRAQDQYSGLGLKVIGPALDEADAVRPMLARFKINYPVTADFASGDLAMRAFGNDKGALPFTVLIDPDGFIVERNLGGLSSDELDGLLQRHLGKS
ncbi:TlpA family protein disulfide reductase [Solimonas terrae]|uniref:TlpA family protein disulfide reductase n=1 Tax=Solimonas terrae TaxID=1396819 RepID=A0A6M2BTQ0_9GAMM|nr:TlpA disulfide reductase family protein [Solimonas terrae]NGY05379.1 TlpA family protein disulfide reductase [Solimonas terrae]